MPVFNQHCSFKHISMEMKLGIILILTAALAAATENAE